MQFSVSASRRDNCRPGLVAPPQLDAHSTLCDPAPSPPDSKGWTQKPPLAFAYICRFRSTLPLRLANISYTGRNNAEEGMLQWQCILCVSKISIYIYLNEGITEFYSRIMKCCIVLLFGLKLHFSELSSRIFFCIFVAVAVWVKGLGVWGLGSGVRIRTQASVECVPGVALDGSPLGCESPANVPIIIMAQSRGRCRAGVIITQNPEPRAQSPGPKS